MNALKWDREFAFEQAAGDAELLAELLEIFKESSRADINLIGQGLAEGAADKVGAAAHSLKGAAASLGIEAIKDLAMEIEAKSRAGQLDVVREKYEILHNLLQEIESL